MTSSTPSMPLPVVQMTPLRENCEYLRGEGCIKGKPCGYLERMEIHPQCWVYKSIRATVAVAENFANGR